MKKNGRIKLCVCGKEFYTTPYREKEGKGKYCSHICAIEDHKKINSEKTHKICPKCSIEYPVSEFYKWKKHLKWCKSCSKKHIDAYRKTPQGKINSKKWGRITSWRKQGINITFDEYLSILSTQNSKCAICGVVDTELSLAVDHDSVSGKIRGLLCKRCNQGIGLFNHNSNYLEEAAKYLRKEE